MTGLYSLWLTSEDKAFIEFSKIIRKLASEYSGPVFKPHITLPDPIDGVQDEVVAKTEKLACSLSPFEVQFSGIDYKATFHQALYVLVEKNRLLVEAYRLASHVFGFKLGDYMPHLSLLYGHYPVALKKKIIKNIDSRFAKTAKITHLALWNTEGSYEENWFEVKKWPLRCKK